MEFKCIYLKNKNIVMSNQYLSGLPSFFGTMLNTPDPDNDLIIYQEGDDTTLLPIKPLYAKNFYNGGENYLEYDQSTNDPVIRIKAVGTYLVTWSYTANVGFTTTSDTDQFAVILQIAPVGGGVGFFGNTYYGMSPVGFTSSGYPFPLDLTTRQYSNTYTTILKPTSPGTEIHFYFDLEEFPPNTTKSVKFQDEHNDVSIVRIGD